MTLNQLLNEVYSLGFEDVRELDESFVFCANRALRLILLELGGEKISSIFIRNKNISYRVGSYTHIPGDDKEFTVSGAAFSFRFSGKGEYTVIDKNGKRTKEFSGKKGEIRGLLSTDAKIVFTGNYCYDVFDFTVFSSLSDSDISSVPIVSEIMEYNLNEYISDLMLTTRAALDKNGKIIVGASIESNVLRLPCDFSGEIIVYYKKLPEKIYIDDQYQKIDIPNFCEHLLPLLTASYIWLDDDPEKADYYMRIFRDEANRIKYSFRNNHGGTYSDITGWA